jgi:hypothetical protein
MLKNRMLRYVYLLIQLIGLFLCFSHYIPFPFNIIAGLIVMAIGGLGYRYESKRIKAQKTAAAQ